MSSCLGFVACIPCWNDPTCTKFYRSAPILQLEPTYVPEPSYVSAPEQLQSFKFYRSAPEPSYLTVPEPSYGAVLVPSYVPEPEPAPTYNAPKPAPTYIESEPAPTYTEPEPAPTYIEPEPAPTYNAPEPVPTYTELEPAPTYTKPEPAYKEAKKTRKNLKRKIRKNLKRKMRKNRRKTRRKNRRKNVPAPSYLRGNTNLENQSLLTHSSKTTLLFSIPIRSNSCHSTQTKKGILFNLRLNIRSRFGKKKIEHFRKFVIFCE